MKNQFPFKKIIAIISVIAVMLCALPMGASAAVYSEYFTLDELKESIAGEGTQEMPIVKEITFNSDEVAMYDKLEVRFNIDGNWENPYDPDDIRVDGVFTYPSGKTVTVPAFFMTPMKFTNEEKINITYRHSSSVVYDPEYQGKSIWCLRFSGDEEGDYSFYITVTDAQGNSSKSTNYEFSCYDAGNKGYAKISESNPAYVVNSYDGSVYYGSGVNIPWVRSQFTKDPEHMSYNYFVNRAKGTTNMSRIWICHWNWLEWSPNSADAASFSYMGLGYYNQIISCSFDYIFEMCEEAGIRFMLTLEDNNEHFDDGSYDNWKFNPYSVANGGTALNTDHYFSDPDVRKQYKKRIRYIVARWGYSSALYSLNLWNDCQTPNDNVVSYLDELNKYTDELVGEWRPLLFGSNFNYDANKVLDYTAQVIGNADGTKPYVTQECYVDSDARNSLRDSLWSDLIRGASATMYWSPDVVDEWDNNKGCWEIFDYILDFTADIPFDTTGKFVSKGLPITAAEAVTKSDNPRTVTEIKPYGDVGEWGFKNTESFFEIDPALPGMNLVGYQVTLYGNKHASTLRNPPNFVVDFPNGGEVTFEYSENSHGQLQVSIDEAVADVIDYSATEKWHTVKVAPGKHTVSFDNIGPDWLRIRKLYFISSAKDQKDMLNATGIVSDTTAVVYIKNNTYNATVIDMTGDKATDFQNVKFTVDGLKEDGAYAMYQYNPDTGEYLAAEKVTVTGGKVDISIAKITRDYAIKLMKLKDGEEVGEGAKYEYLQLVSTASPNTPSGDDANEGDDAADPNNKGNETGGFPWIVVVIAVVVLAAGAAAFILISKKKKAAAPTEEKPEDKE